MRVPGAHSSICCPLLQIPAAPGSPIPFIIDLGPRGGGISALQASTPINRDLRHPGFDFGPPARPGSPTLDFGPLQCRKALVIFCRAAGHPAEIGLLLT